uniref:Uncharacterized protein n=1 Tax=Panagrolaimus sp. PS1159 TaxID=55785 RepID=A0AC35F133_9BILA
MVGNENGQALETVYGYIEEICDEIDADILNSQKILDFVQSETFSNILYFPWNEPKTLTEFLRIIVTLKRYASDERFSILEIFDKVLKSNLLKTIIPKNISSMKESQLKNRIQAKLFHFVIEILLFGYEHHLSKMDDYESDVHVIVSSMKFYGDIMLEMTKEKFAQLEKIYTDIQKLKAEKAQMKAKAQFKTRNFNGNGILPPENFRSLPLIPSPAELEISFEPYLRSAKIFEPYSNSEHYLDVQFRLLREDLISPLRTGIEETKTGKSRMYSYKNVKFVGIDLYLPSGEYIHYVKIQESQLRLCMKTLKKSSLLCLSSDKYRSEFIFASVMDREECLMFDEKIGIKFEGEYNIDFSKEYQMVESPAYFEAYRHILLALQVLTANGYPKNYNLK